MRVTGGSGESPAAAQQAHNIAAAQWQLGTFTEVPSQLSLKSTLQPTCLENRGEEIRAEVGASTPA